MTRADADRACFAPAVGPATALAGFPSLQMSPLPSPPPPLPTAPPALPSVTLDGTVASLFNQSLSSRRIPTTTLWYLEVVVVVVLVVVLVTVLEVLPTATVVVPALVTATSPPVRTTSLLARTTNVAPAASEFRRLSFARSLTLMTHLWRRHPLVRAREVRGAHERRHHPIPKIQPSADQADLAFMERLVRRNRNLLRWLEELPQRHIQLLDSAPRRPLALLMP